MYKAFVLSTVPANGGVHSAFSCYTRCECHTVGAAMSLLFQLSQTEFLSACKAWLQVYQSPDADSQGH